MKNEKEKGNMNGNGEKKKNPIVAFAIIAVIIILECAVIVKIMG